MIRDAVVVAGYPRFAFADWEVGQTASRSRAPVSADG